MSFGEALYASTPLVKALKNKAPNSLNYQALNFDKKIDKEIKTLLGSSITELKNPVLDINQIANDLEIEPKLDSVDATIAELSAQDSLDYITTNENARQLLKKQSPIKYKQTLTGIKEKARSKAQEIRFKRKARVINDPFSVFNRMNSGSISSDEVTTLMSVYPNVYQGMKDKLILELSKKQNIPKQKERAIRKFLAIPSQRSEAFNISFQSSQISETDTTDMDLGNIKAGELLTAGTKQAAGILG